MTIAGTVAAGFAPVRAAFAANLAAGREAGAAVCVYRHGEPVVDLWGGSADPATGRAWQADTLQVLYSATKGVTAACAHLLVQRGQLDLDAPVARYWPEFAAAGKDRLPVRWLLSHQAGLAAVDRRLPVADALAWDPMVTALAAQAPQWPPGTAHGYHGLTFGWLVGELVRRVAGQRIGAFLASEIVAPLGLDLMIGLPAAHLPRVSRIVEPPARATTVASTAPGSPNADAPSRPSAGAPGPRITGAPDPRATGALGPRVTGALGPRVTGGPGPRATGSLAGPGSLTMRSLLVTVPALDLNDPAVLAAELPAVNGVGTARSLARCYAALIGEVDGVRLLSPHTLAAATAEQAAGLDLVLGVPTRTGLGFSLPTPDAAWYSPSAFGVAGHGGSLGYADPATGVAFGYVMNRLLTPPSPDDRAASLVRAVRACVAT